MPRKKAWNLRKNLKRNVNQLRPRKTFLIMTEGETEAIYFGHYRQSPNPIVFVIDKSDSKRSLVEKAINERNARITDGSFLEGIDEAWVVLDRDITPSNPRDKTNFNEGLQIAKNNNIFVAYSNDAFELWLLLHFQEVSTALHRDIICKKLSQHIGKKYEKGTKSDIYDLIKNRREEAVKRAIRMLEAHKNTDPETANPSTTVHTLVEKIMSQPGYRDQ